MDELRLLAELRHETPPITAAAARSARARLLGPRRETSRYWTRIDRKRVAIEYRGRIYQYPNYQRSSVYPWPTFAYLRRLPTNPQALLARLATGTVLEWQARTAVAIVDRPGQRH